MYILFWTLIFFQETDLSGANQQKENSTVSFQLATPGSEIQIGDFTITIPDGTFFADEDNVHYLFNLANTSMIRNCRGMFFKQTPDGTYSISVQYNDFQRMHLAPVFSQEEFLDLFSKRHFHRGTPVKSVASIVFPPVYNQTGHDKGDFSLGLRYQDDSGNAMVYVKKIWVYPEETLLFSLQAPENVYIARQDEISNILNSVEPSPRIKNQIGSEYPSVSYLEMLGVPSPANFSAKTIILGVLLLAFGTFTLAAFAVLKRREKDRPASSDKCATTDWVVGTMKTTQTYGQLLLSKKALLFSLLLWSGSFILFLPTTNHGILSYDDRKILLEHPNLYNAPTVSQCLNEIVFDYYPREEPLILRDISWVIDSKLFGFDNPFGYHWTNVIIHSFNVTLLFVFLLLFTGHFEFSGISALVFGTLAVHVEPVAWIMGRKDLLAAFFVLLTLIFMTKWMQEKPGRKGALFYALSILTSLGALLSKINTLSLWMVLVLLQLIFAFYCRKKPFTLSTLRTLVPKSVMAVLPHAILSLLVFFWYQNVLESFGVLASDAKVHPNDHVFGFFMFNPLVFGIYVKNILFPSGLSGSYMWPSFYYPLLWQHMVLSIGILVFTCLGTWFLFLKDKILCMVFLAFACLMLPYSNFIYIGIWIANRYVYLSSLCLVIMIVACLFKVYQKSKTSIRYGVIVFFVVWLGVNIIQTIRHIPNWATDQAFGVFETSLAYPSSNAFFLLSASYIKDAQRASDQESSKELLEKARHTVNRGLELFDTKISRRPVPVLDKLYLNLALISEQEKDLDAAIRYLNLSLDINPTSDSSNIQLANIYYGKALSSASMMEKMRYAHLAIQYFHNYVLGSLNDPHVIDNVPANLARFRNDFPFLEPRLRNIMSQLPNKNNQ